jgi:hypothetical protein
MLGEEGTALLGTLSGQAMGKGASATQAWGNALSKSMPTGFGAIRSKIQKAFLKNLLKRQGSALIGRALPFGIGAVVGGGGNLIMGRAVAANAKEAFGPMPDTIPGELKATAAAAETNTAANNTLEGTNLGS